MKGRHSTKRQRATNLAERRLEEWEEKICQDSDFGKDFMFEILVRLPIKCLLRFKTVSKYWFRLIGSPEFIKFRFQKACDDPNYTQHKFLFNDLYRPGLVLRQTPLYPTLCDPDSYHRLDTDILHFTEFWEEESQLHVLKFVGSCSGLVCVAGLNDRLMIWNPALRKCKRLPYFGRGSSVFYGFGYDESSDDFKVVGIRNTPKTLVKIYSARTNSWKKLEEDGFEVARLNGHGCHINGKLHWASNKSVFTVNLSTEQFGVIELPDSSRVRECYDWSVHAVGEFLAVFCYHSTNLEIKEADLWMMDDSWTRVNMSLDGFPVLEEIFVFAIKAFERPFCFIRVTPSEPGEAPGSIRIPGHMTGNGIVAFLLYCIKKLDDYVFDIGLFLPYLEKPATVYVESLVWPFQ